MRTIVRVKYLKHGKATGTSFRVYKIGETYFELSPTGLIDSLEITNVTENYPRTTPKVRKAKEKKSKKLNVHKVRRRIASHEQSIRLIKEGRPYNYKGDDPKKLKKQAQSALALKKLESEVANLAKRFPEAE